MNNEINKFTDIEALFASARQAQPNLMDDNFTTRLVNSLPKVSLASRKESAKKGFSFDLIGAFLGLVMAYLFVDKTSLLNAFAGLIPETFVITPLLIIAAVVAVSVSSLIAWWTVEDNRL